MNTPPARPTPSVEERAVTMYREIMGVSQSAAEQAYMLVEASHAGLAGQGVQSAQGAREWNWAPWHRD